LLLLISLQAVILIAVVVVVATPVGVANRQKARKGGRNSFHLCRKDKCEALKKAITA